MHRHLAVAVESILSHPMIFSLLYLDWQYKVETIGDAYMCCSGLPFPDDYHAENVANFAVAVLECVKHVLSPVDGTPISLRIGIHTGSCTAGVGRSSSKNRQRDTQCGIF